MTDELAKGATGGDPVVADVLNPLERRMVELWCFGDPETGEFYTYAGLGRVIGRGSRWVRRKLQKDPMVMAEVDKASSEALGSAKVELAKRAPRMVRRLEKLASTAVKDTGPQVKAAVDFLHMAGMKPTVKQEVSGAGGGPIGIFAVVGNAYEERERRRKASIDIESTGSQ